MVSNGAMAVGHHWRRRDYASRLATDEGEPLDRPYRSIDITIHNAITELNWNRHNARGALALGRGRRTCATCAPPDQPGHPPWQCQLVGATTMRWELCDPWPDAVYYCATCYDTGCTEHVEWDVSPLRPRP